jgi:hypothetical protein
VPRTPVAALLFLILLTASVRGQTKDKPNKALTELVPGYKRHVIEGFNLLVSKEVMAQNEKGEHERKPLEVLELELKIISQIMTPSALRVLRRLVIWVEWNEEDPQLKTAIAVYYGGHQAQMLKEGRHPLKANNITVLRMQKLTAEHQPKRDSGRCVLLHEIAHAVHHQLLGFENGRIKTAYNQALERKLLDRTVYAATNDHEFFAEMTCAYLDRLHYCPHTRADLQKHDPVTYQLMESIWGKAKRDVGVRPDPRGEGAEYSLDLTFEGVTFAKPISGPAVQAEDLKGKVVLFIYWGGGQGARTTFGKLQSWHEELADLGLVLALSNFVREEDHVREDARARKVSFSILSQTFLKGPSETITFPHAAVFDHKGKCIFRGSPFVAESYTRKAIANRLLESLAIEEYADALRPVIDSMKKGDPPSAVLSRLAGLKTAGKKPAEDQARALVAILTQPARSRIDHAESMMKDDPLGAFLMLESIPTKFRGTAEATRATKDLTTLRTRKPVLAELDARNLLVSMQKLDTQLAARPGSSNPKSQEFQRANLVVLLQMQNQLQRIKKLYPEAPSTALALDLGKKYGLMVQ